MGIKFQVDAGKCTKCGGCIADCPARIIDRADDGLPVARPEREDRCLRCQHCLTVCPTGAVSVLELDPAKSLPVDPAAWPDPQELELLMRGRRSIRHFEQRSVEPALLDRLLAAISCAPTGRNACGLTFQVVENRAAMEQLLERIFVRIDAAQAAGMELPEFMTQAVRLYREKGIDLLFRGAPQLLLVSPSPESACGREDAVIALSYFDLLAPASGLGTTWCGYLKFIDSVLPATKELFGLAPDRYFYAMLFGYPRIRHWRTVQRDRAAAIRKIDRF